MLLCLYKYTQNFPFSATEINQSKNHYPTYNPYPPRHGPFRFYNIWYLTMQFYIVLWPVSDGIRFVYMGSGLGCGLRLLLRLLAVGLSVSNFSMTTFLSLVPDESSVTCDSVRPEESLSRFCVTLASVLSVISVLMDDDTLRLAEQPRRPKMRVNSIIFFIFIALLRRIRHNKMPELSARA